MSYYWILFFKSSLISLAFYLENSVYLYFSLLLILFNLFLPLNWYFLFVQIFLWFIAPLSCLFVWTDFFLIFSYWLEIYEFYFLKHFLKQVERSSLKIGLPHDPYDLQLHMHAYIVFSHKKEEVLPFVTTCMKLKDILSSEISQRNTNTE